MNEFERSTRSTEVTKRYQHSLVWFTQDLRLHDNAVISQAHASSDAVLHVFFMRDVLREGIMPGLKSIGDHRRRFLHQGLADLKQQLQALGHDLLILDQHSHEGLPTLIEAYQINAVFHSKTHEWHERKEWAAFDRKYHLVDFIEEDTFTLYSEEDLPFSFEQLPEHFTVFQKQIEADKTPLRDYEPSVQWAKPISYKRHDYLVNLPNLGPNNQHYVGGESVALNHLQQYFSSDLSSSYKTKRNELLGGDASTIFSPWLSQGSLSATDVLQAAQGYEKSHGPTQYTNTIYHELLWREYYFWLAIATEDKLFLRQGTHSYTPLTSFYPDRFQSWTHGTTEWPIVNACMHELAETGLISNRSRQLVASCLINELSLDWRYGAAYFEQQLIDYDVGLNWGRWRFQAGVGDDSNHARHLDLNKQTSAYDPNGDYISNWHGKDTMVPTNARCCRLAYPINSSKLYCITIALFG